ncbi:membrane protein [Pseudomonas phage Stalingrad]|uniref:Membrane protein n=1 Tax=Pseudomonas phage Stalingrad TaxID=2762287 RepID=A0A7G8LJ70_9CAUD|nr:membrane protein [Pseudomonas phage Stalingrad]
MSAVMTAVTSAIIASSIAASDSSGGSGVPLTSVGAVLLLGALAFFVVGLSSMLVAMVRSRFDHIDDFLIEKGMVGGWIIAAILFVIAFGHDIYAAQ